MTACWLMVSGLTVVKTMSLLDWASVLASMLNYHLDVYRQMFWPFTLLGSMYVHSDVCGQNVLTFLAVKFYCHCWRLWAKCFDLSGCEIILSLLTFVGKTFWPFWLWYFTVTADVCGQNVLTFLAVEIYCHYRHLWAKRFYLSGCEMLPSLLTFMGHTCYLLTRLHITVMLTFMGRSFWRFIYKDYCHFEVYRPSVRPFRLLDITVEVTFIGKPFEPFMTFSAISLTVKTVIHVPSSSSDCMMHDQLLWETADPDETVERLIV